MSTALDALTAVLLLAGAAFCLLGALGLLRFADTLSRLHAATKAQTLGLLLILLGAAAQVSPRYAVVLVLVALFQLVTVPVTGQIVGRTAYRTQAVRRPGLVLDELGERLRRDARARGEAAGQDSEGGDAEGGEAEGGEHAGS
ncbi:monovalent cation/H(+) antiporter subunit G [Streptomyces sp. N2-109]|uniref:Monovalent cation/H(+) antiporter subunit G n=1 Tax=Streptomyces gossypii TaxID=2883101 RepID=A0ABT2JSW2_9ACTN|nr:monovalent cation/H(+) antiporter subunit G [Streptomyces gossypii]MCT2590972.1 monovalent cation/H(+) antiporter subunit G [Streptomyces gossypii]